MRELQAAAIEKDSDHSVLINGIHFIEQIYRNKDVSMRFVLHV